MFFTWFWLSKRVFSSNNFLAAELESSDWSTESELQFRSEKEKRKQFKDRKQSYSTCVKHNYPKFWCKSHFEVDYIVS